MNADLRCVECDRERYDRQVSAEGFAVRDEVAVYCPECAEREFGGKGERPTDG